MNHTLVFVMLHKCLDAFSAAEAYSHHKILSRMHVRFFIDSNKPCHKECILQFFSHKDYVNVEVSFGKELSVGICKDNLPKARRRAFSKEDVFQFDILYLLRILDTFQSSVYKADK